MALFCAWRKGMLQDTQLVVFDIDGTLLDSVCFNVENMNHTLEHFQYTYRVQEACVRNYLGCAAEEYYKGVLDESCVENWEAIRAYNRANMAETMKKYGKSFEGVAEVFALLKNKGYKLVLYSNCSRAYMEAALDVLGIRENIDYAECVKDHGLAKPNLLAKILKMYKDCKAVVVGDRVHDVEAARDNHIPCIGALYGFGKKEELKEAEYVLKSIKELPDVLDKEIVHAYNNK